MCHHYCNCPLHPFCMYSIGEEENCNIKTLFSFVSAFFISHYCRGQLVSTDSRDDNMVSYGVRNSIAAYLSFSGNQDPVQIKAKNRKKKSKSVYALPTDNLANIEYEDDF